MVNAVFVKSLHSLKMLLQDVLCDIYGAGTEHSVTKDTISMFECKHLFTYWQIFLSAVFITGWIGIVISLNLELFRVVFLRIHIVLFNLNSIS